jgi:hypothetical protein
MPLPPRKAPADLRPAKGQRPKPCALRRQSTPWEYLPRSKKRATTGPYWGRTFQIIALFAPTRSSSHWCIGPATPIPKSGFTHHAPVNWAGTSSQTHQKPNLPCLILPHDQPHRPLSAAGAALGVPGALPWPKKIQFQIATRLALSWVFAFMGILSHFRECSQCLNRQNRQNRMGKFRPK